MHVFSGDVAFMIMAAGTRRSPQKLHTLVSNVGCGRFISMSDSSKAKTKEKQQLKLAREVLLRRPIGGSEKAARQTAQTRERKTRG